jgi:hypothetical protein
LTGNEDVWQSFPPKPALGSPTDQTDLLITLSLQASRTEDQKTEAFRDRNYSIKLVTDVIDVNFETQYPNTFKVLNNADIDSYFINTMIKKANGRLRPYVQHPTLVVPLFSVSDFSYPSGHASGLELQARILGQLFPAQSDALLNVPGKSPTGEWLPEFTTRAIRKLVSPWVTCFSPSSKPKLSSKKI